ncbi:MAG: class I SAM-dependent methyltransferase [Deltaproteobacteria bacterium]|nr:class I SAM-dependent methyltransferase [Deltaproteobacteria bacterium]
MKTEEYHLMSRIEKTHWWFIGKRFLVDTTLRGLLSHGPRSQTHLDVGCGTGMVLDLLQGFGKAFGVELSSEALSYLRPAHGHQIALADAAQAVPFRDNTFSIITCLDVLEHLDDDDSALREAYRVCAPGGHMILTVPALRFLWGPHDEALHHRRRYTRSGLLRALSRCKWQVARCSYYNTILFFPILAVRILNRCRQRGVRPRSDLSLAVPRWLNAALSRLFCTEIRLLRFLDFPFGVSILAVLKKPAIL